MIEEKRQFLVVHKVELVLRPDLWNGQVDYDKLNMALVVLQDPKDVFVDDFDRHLIVRCDRIRHLRAVYYQRVVLSIAHETFSASKCDNHIDRSVEFVDGATHLICIIAS